MSLYEFNTKRFDDLAYKIALVKELKKSNKNYVKNSLKLASKKEKLKLDGQK